LCLGVFIAASTVMVWRLEKISQGGVEGTVLGTLCMPYLSGLGNLIFVAVILKNNGSGNEIVVNCLVNNTTNMTLLLGLPALIWGLSVLPPKRGRTSQKARKKARIHRLSLLLTLIALVVFSGVLWALGQDGHLNRGDGLTLIAIFLFWQGFHVYEVVKENIQKPKPYSGWLLLDFVALILCGLLMYLSIEWLVSWLLKIESGFISKEKIGLLSGWLMVLPNAILAFYYAASKRPDVVYSSQLGDAHICIPLCVGLYAVVDTIPLAGPFNLGLALIVGASVVHFICLTALGRLPRWVGGILVAAYAGYFYLGFV